jgi:hypothetical protein
VDAVEGLASAGEAAAAASASTSTTAAAPLPAFPMDLFTALRAHFQGAASAYNHAAEAGAAPPAAAAAAAPPVPWEPPYASYARMRGTMRACERSAVSALALLARDYVLYGLSAACSRGGRCNAGSLQVALGPLQLQLPAQAPGFQASPLPPPRSSAMLGACTQDMLWNSAVRVLRGGEAGAGAGAGAGAVDAEAARVSVLLGHAGQGSSSRGGSSGGENSGFNSSIPLWPFLLPRVGAQLGQWRAQLVGRGAGSSSSSSSSSSSACSLPTELELLSAVLQGGGAQAGRQGDFALPLPWAWAALAGQGQGF